MKWTRVLTTNLVASKTGDLPGDPVAALGRESLFQEVVASRGILNFDLSNDIMVYWITCEKLPCEHRWLYDTHNADITIAACYAVGTAVTRLWISINGCLNTSQMVYSTCIWLGLTNPWVVNLSFTHITFAWNFQSHCVQTNFPYVKLQVLEVNCEYKRLYHQWGIQRCVFWENLANLYVSTLSKKIGAPSYGESWIRPWPYKTQWRIQDFQDGKGR